MRLRRLQDRYYWGLNRVAKHIGEPYYVYRPLSRHSPLDYANRILQCHAQFSAVRGGFQRPVEYGVALWSGYFDAAYTKAGDYISDGSRTWFIVSKESLQPVLCARCNKVVNIARPDVTAIDNATAAIAPQSETALITDWPASVLGLDSSGRPDGRLPDDVPNMAFRVLLPAGHGEVFRPTDIILDEGGARYVVTAVELSHLGWRLNAKRLST